MEKSELQETIEENNPQHSNEPDKEFSVQSALHDKADPCAETLEVSKQQT